MANTTLNNFINWKAARGQEGGMAFQRIHIKPGLYFHKIFQIKTDDSTQYIHTYQKVNDSYFNVDSNTCYYTIKGPENNDKYTPDNNSNNELPNTDNKSTMSGKYAITDTSETFYGVGSFKIVEVKSDEGRPYDFD